ncbi:phage tail protein [Paenibacillus sp. ACRRY]|uniref:tail fiber protein n=1 Tax=Paenibacillus sp. ACRRY TaxID=2918208 RepID=UPI001EF5A73E|nr:phage tail protein [Paenibacillus sp. ACRRY]MCG7386866.1 phage tail protein [Paenibacillus sp. ACRRY]
MATTPNLGLPLIDGAMTADIPRDMNALANAVDTAVEAAIDDAVAGVTIPDASLTVKGKTQLSSATNSTLEDRAATPKAVKTAYDEAVAAKQLGVEQKANVVAALNSIGVTASTSETWAQLIPKISAVIRATGNATATQVLAGSTFSNASANGLTGTMANRGAGGTVTPGTSNQTKAAGYYSSAINILGDADLIATNIRSGVDIFGVVGSLVEGKTYATGTMTLTSTTPPSMSGLSFRPSIVLLKLNNGNPQTYLASYWNGYFNIYYSSNLLNYNTFTINADGWTFAYNMAAGTLTWLAIA